MKITENVYLLDSTAPSYTYLITGKENTLIDTGIGFRRKGLLKDIEALNIPLQSIKHIYITHNDVDHIGNAAIIQELTGAALWASSEDIPFITGEKERYGKKKIISKIIRTKKPEAITPFAANEALIDIRVLPAPGHTPGHVCFLYGDVLFAGDLLENKGGKLYAFHPSANWDHELLLRSLKEIYNYDFKWVCPAHGSPVLRQDYIIQ